MSAHPLEGETATQSPTGENPAKDLAREKEPVGVDHSAEEEPQSEPGPIADFWFIPIPKRLQYDSSRQVKFSTALSAVFGLASTFTVANLYYCQPLLIQLANSFKVTDQEVSRIPTLVQAGYATGILLLSPLGDLVRRRPLLLLLVFISGSLSIGLAATNSLVVFETISFLIGVFSVTPQVLIPFAFDLAPPHRRGSAISIVLGGLLFGILLARVLAGTIAQFTTWHVVFYMAIGVQFSILLLLYVMVPDWPAKNKGKGVTYASILYTMAKYSVTEPILIQASIMQFAASACFASFWVTLTFLLSGPPYNYNTLEIGLFGLVGMLGVANSPLAGKLVDRLVPWYATFVGTMMQIVFQAVQTGAGGIHVAAVIIACFGIDIGRQTQQVSLTSAVYNISESSRARMNAVLIMAIFLGQVTGTAAGTELFLRYGWRVAAGFSMALYGWQIVVLLLRGPHCERYTWFGYQGGAEFRRSVVEEREDIQKNEQPKTTDEEKPPSLDERARAVENKDLFKTGETTLLSTSCPSRESLRTDKKLKSPDVVRRSVVEEREDIQKNEQPKTTDEEKPPSLDERARAVENKDLFKTGETTLLSTSCPSRESLRMDKKLKSPDAV